MCAILWTLSPVPLLKHSAQTCILFHGQHSCKAHTCPDISGEVCCASSRNREESTAQTYPTCSKIRIKEKEYFDCGKIHYVHTLLYTPMTTHWQQQVADLSVSSHSGLSLVHFQILFFTRDRRSELRWRYFVNEERSRIQHPKVT